MGGLSVYLYQALTGPVLLTGIEALSVKTPEDLAAFMFIASFFWIACRPIFYGCASIDDFAAQSWGKGMEIMVLGPIIVGFSSSALILSLALLYVGIRLIATIIPDYHYSYENCSSAAPISESTPAPQ